MLEKVSVKERQKIEEEVRQKVAEEEEFLNWRKSQIRQSAVYDSKHKQ